MGAVKTGSRRVDSVPLSSDEGFENVPSSIIDSIIIIHVDIKSS